VVRRSQGRDVLRGIRARCVLSNVVITVPSTSDVDQTAVEARAIAPLLGAGTASASGDGVVDRVLALARVHLGLDISWFSRFSGDVHVLDHVSGDTARFNVAEGTISPAFASYCSRVVAGELPNVIPDALADERTRDLPLTQYVGIGAYAGVPVVLPGGEIYGMLCCIGRDAHPEIDTGDVRFMRVLASLLSDEVERQRPLDEVRNESHSRIAAAIAGTGLRMAFQPIVRLDTLRIAGAEALSRFDGGPPTPDGWFREAAGVGLETELQSASLRLAMAAIPALPDDVYLSVNASPELIMLWADRELPEGVPYNRVLLEITEHDPIDDYDVLLDALEPLRDRGVRIAIDDAGAGYSSFRHILLIKPDVIKLDISITRGIDQDGSRRALATALISFAAEIDASLVAEGVETVAEMETLQHLGATFGQGYLFARPGPLPLPAIDARSAMAKPARATRSGPAAGRRLLAAGKPVGQAGVSRLGASSPGAHTAN
jgi:EAL domain-containing protein (putative c-di-GMP-specific phosphodiesterase class I)